MCFRMKRPATSRVGRPGWPGSRLAHRAEATIEKAPIDLTRQAHQRMPHVDDLIERRPQQVLLAIVSRSSHLTPPSTPATGAQGNRITNREKSESQNARKRASMPAFLQNRL